MYMIIGDDMNKVLKTRQELLSQLDDYETAIESGPNSALGKRSAYESLVIQQRQTFDGICYVTFFALITSYSFSSAKLKNKKKILAPPLLTVDVNGVITLTSHTKKFSIGEYVFTRLRKDCVVNLCPHVPIDGTDERSCYSTLLIHIPWPIEGESNILLGFSSSVECLQDLQINNKIPEYVKGTLDQYKRSDIIRGTMGTVSNMTEEVSDVYIFNTPCDEEGVSRFDNLSPNVDENPILLSLTSDTNKLGVIKNITLGNKQFFMNYIKNKQAEYISKISSENTISNENYTMDNNSDNVAFSRVNNYEQRMETLSSNVLKLTKKQLKAYNIAVEYICGRKGKQLIMFVTGEGGTGKSFLISLIMEYTQLLYGKQRGLYGAAIAIAPTGSAANVVDGYTWQAVYGKGRSKDKKLNKNDCTMSSATAKAVGAKVLGLKLIILDEISMINLATLYEISERQIAAMGTQSDSSERDINRLKPFGGMHIIFTGDFYQLKPIQPEAIYTSNPKSLQSIRGLKIWHNINEFVVLNENTRYKDDVTPVMNSFLSSARKGIVDHHLLHNMNERVMLTSQAAKRLAGPDAVWIAHENKVVQKFNDDDLLDKISEGARHFRIYAKHTPASELISFPDDSMISKLLKISKVGCAPPYLDFAIGTKVSCTMNLGTQIGNFIFNVIIHKRYEKIKFVSIIYARTIRDLIIVL